MTLLNDAVVTKIVFSVIGYPQAKVGGELPAVHHLVFDRVLLMLLVISAFTSIDEIFMCGFNEFGCPHMEMNLLTYCCYLAE
ncbi:MAG: hypothetical protein WC457_02360 [Patescibacteria group bacterium]